jgi:hypothetical protein
MEFETSISRSIPDLSIDMDDICNVILNAQLPSGEIPWCDGQKTDPWDHVEAAMGLSVGGYLPQARRAFEWMVQNQNEPKTKPGMPTCPATLRWGCFTITSSPEIFLF